MCRPQHPSRWQVHPRHTESTDPKTIERRRPHELAEQSLPNGKPPDPPGAVPLGFSQDGE